jgi:hypothetical protein
LWKWLIGTVIGVVTLAIALITLYWEWKPKLIIEVRQNSDNPINAEFVLKNQGRLCLSQFRLNAVFEQTVKTTFPKDEKTVFRNTPIHLGQTCAGEERVFRLPYNEKMREYWIHMNMCIYVEFTASLPFGRQKYEQGFFIKNERGLDRWVSRQCDELFKKLNPPPGVARP